MRLSRSTLRLRLGWTLALGLLGSLGCAQASSAEVQVTDAWIRWLPPNVPWAGYMTLVNTGSVRHSLVAVTTPAFAEVSIHESREAQGMSAMRPVTSIILEPKVPVRFAPGGYHLMLMRPVRPIRVGDTVIMTLHFAEAPPVDVAFYVRAGEAG